MNLMKINKIDFIFALLIATLMTRQVFYKDIDDDFYNAISSFTFNLCSPIYTICLTIFISLIVPMAMLFIVFYDIYRKEMSLKNFLETVFTNHIFFCFITLCSLYITDVVHDYYRLEGSTIKRKYTSIDLQNDIPEVPPPDFSDFMNMKSTLQETSPSSINLKCKENHPETTETISGNSNPKSSLSIDLSRIENIDKNYDKLYGQLNLINENSNSDSSESNYEISENPIPNSRRSEWHKYIFHFLLTPALFIDAVYSIEIQKIHHKEQKCFLLKTANNLNFIERKRYSNKIYFFSQFIIVAYLLYCLSVVLFIEGQLEEIIFSAINFTQPNIPSGISFYVQNLSNSAMGCVFLTLFFGLIDQGVIVEKFISLFSFERVCPRWYGIG